MPRPAKPKQQYPPNWAEFEWPDLWVLSFDQTLGHTGWALLRFSQTAPPKVALYGTVALDAEAKGFAGSFDKAERLAEELNRILFVCCEHAGHDIGLLVHEMPSVGGFRIESSLMAATVLRTIVRLGDGLSDTQIVTISNVRMKTWLLGSNSRKALKSEVEVGLWRVIEEFRTNEHVRDACALGIAAVAERWLVDKEAQQRVALL